jgi:catechol 2,3-dioxygenase-like lactoylglutathione lyase family enzyme
MIGYVTLGTNNLDRAGAFYDRLAAELGAGRVMEAANFIAWGRSDGDNLIALHIPFDGRPATVGNGVMVALAARDAAQVDRIHALALSIGGIDEGAPGYRGENFYAAFFRDLDGNKLNAYVLL